MKPECKKKSFYYVPKFIMQVRLNFIGHACAWQERPVDMPMYLLFKIWYQTPNKLLQSQLKQEYFFWHILYTIIINKEQWTFLSWIIIIVFLHLNTIMYIIDILVYYIIIITFTITLYCC